MTAGAWLLDVDDLAEVSPFRSALTLAATEISREIDAVFRDPSVLSAAWWLDDGQDVDAFAMRYTVQPLPYVADGLLAIATIEAIQRKHPGADVRIVTRKGDLARAGR